MTIRPDPHFLRYPAFFIGNREKSGIPCWSISFGVKEKEYFIRGGDNSGE